MTQNELTALKLMHEDIIELKADVKSLLYFKAWAAGAVCAAFALGGILVKFIN